MGLRDYLLGLKGIEQSTGEFAKTAEELRKQGEAAEFKKKLPGLLESGDVSGIVAGAPGELLPTYLKGIMEQQSGKGTKQQYTPAALKNLGLTDAEISEVQNIPGAQQPDYLTKLRQKKEFDLKQHKDTLATDDTARRQRGFSAGQFKETFSKARDQLMDEERKIRGIEKVSSFGTLAGNRPILNFVARSIGDEKGPLAESDIAGFIPQTFLGDVQKFKNYIAGTPEQDWTEEVKGSMVQIVNFARENFETYKDRKVGFLLSDSLTNPDLQEKDGTPVERVQNLAKEFGFKYNKEQDRFEKAGKKKEMTPSEAGAMKLPPEKKAQYDAYISQIKAKKGAKIGEKKFGEAEAIEEINRRFGVK